MTLAQIRKAICREFDVKPSELTGRNFERHVCEARHAFALLATEATRMTAASISRRTFGENQHTSFYHGVKKAKDLRDIDPDYRARYERAKSLLTKSK